MSKIDWMSKVPLDLEGNLKYRIAIRKRAATDEEFRKALMAACADDMVFFLSVFAWIYEPRPKTVNGKRMPNSIPYVPWPHQVDAFRQMIPYLGIEDIGIEKSRGEGMSWMACYIAIWYWLFVPESKIGIASRTMEAADDPEDSDSMMWKIDWELTKLPRWMAGEKDKDWKRLIANHTLTNNRNKSRISADAATGDLFRGGRLTIAIMDEFAFFPKGSDVEAMSSSHGATNCRIFISTVNGKNNEFYRIMTTPSARKKVVIDWKQNITRNRGLYELKEGIPVAVDPVNNPLPPHYDPPSEETLDMFSRLRLRGFVLEDCQRSPWYDHECDRTGMTQQRIAQELDRDYAGSQSLVFGHEFSKKVTSTCTRPIHEGNITVTKNTNSGSIKVTGNWQSAFNGIVKLWCPLDASHRPPKSDYAFGADISGGSGGEYTSNSTLLGIDLHTGEQVVEIAANTIQPPDFADLSVAVCQMFHGALLGWEQNGPGVPFSKRVVQLQYPNIYYRKNQDQEYSETKNLGWWSGTKEKEALFAEMIRAVCSGEATVKSEFLAREFSQYIYLNGKIEHSASLTTDDESAKGQSHGDRVIGYGVALQCRLDRPDLIWQPGSQHHGNNPEYGSSEWLDKHHRELQEAEEEDKDGWVGSVVHRLLKK